MKLGNILKEFELEMDQKIDQSEPNYMGIQNLKQIIRQCNEILEMDEKSLLDLMNHAPWAVDHISTSKDDLEEVYNYFKSKHNTIGNDINTKQLSFTDMINGNNEDLE